MTQASQQQMKQQLDQLVKQGRSSLLRVARQQAFAKALTAMCWSLAPTVLLSLVWQWLQPTAGLMLLALFALPLLVLACRYLQLMQQVNISRAASLALYDHALADADRLQTADEFFAISEPNGFQLAAIADSAAYIEQALAAEVPRAASQSITFSRLTLLQPVLAVALASLLFWLHPAFNNEAQDIAAARGDNTDAVLSHIDNQFSMAATPASSAAERSANANAVKSAAKPSSSSDKAAVAASASSKANSSQTESGQSKAANAESSADTAATSGAANQSSEAQAASNAKTESPAKPDATQAENNTKLPTAAADERQLPDLADVSAQSGDLSDNSSNQEQATNAPQTGSSQAGQQGQVAGKKQADKSNSNKGQQQSTGDQANPDSQNTGNHGDEGIKKSRGINSLMLAVPMEDQFIGTPGPGSEKRSMQQKQPDEPQLPAFATSDRGSNNSAQPAEPMRAMQPWQIKLLSKFYQQQHADNHNNK